MRKLEGKIAIINGAGPGFGREVSRTFAREGAKVVCCDVVEVNCRGTAGQIIEEGGDAVWFVCDDTKFDQVKAAVDFAVETYGTIDILYNNAGLQGMRYYANILDTEPKDYYYSNEVNVMGHWNFMYNCAPIFHAKKAGVIVDIASAAGVKGGQNTYGATKCGVIGLCRGVAKELGEYGIRVNSVSPFFTKTPLKRQFEGQSEEEAKLIKGFAVDSPMKKVCDIDSVANTILFLASDDAAGITAYDFRVDCGICVKSLPTVTEEEFLEANKY